VKGGGAKMGSMGPNRRASIEKVSICLNRRRVGWAQDCFSAVWAELLGVKREKRRRGRREGGEPKRTIRRVLPS